MLFIGPCHALLLVKLRNSLNVFCCRDLFDFATVATACFTGCLVYMEPRNLRSLYSRCSILSSDYLRNLPARPDDPSLPKSTTNQPKHFRLFHRVGSSTQYETGRPPRGREAACFPDFFPPLFLISKCSTKFPLIVETFLLPLNKSQKYPFFP